MKIGFVCSDYPPGPHGGIGSFVQLTARELVKRGHQVRVIGIYHQDHPGKDREQDEGVEVSRFRDPETFLSWIKSRIGLFKIVSRWARSSEIDLIEVPDYKGFAAFWPKLPVPIISRLNGSATYFAAELSRKVDRLTLLLETSSLRRSDFICSASRYCAERTESIFRLKRSNDRVIYNSVAVPRILGCGPRAKPPRVAFSGTLTKKKGVYSLFAAWPFIKDAVRDAELHIFGKDTRSGSGESVRAELENMLGEALAGSVTFHGHVLRQQLIEFLCSCRAAVFPSYSEAFALAPLEAMACACPTIYSFRASGPELIIDGTDGILVDPEKPADIARAVSRLLLDDELAERLGKAGQQKVLERFSLETVIKQNEEFYRECVLRFHAARS